METSAGEYIVPDVVVPVKRTRNSSLELRRRKKIQAKAGGGESPEIPGWQGQEQ